MALKKISAMDPELHRMMIQVSNNSHLTGQATVLMTDMFANMSTFDKNTFKEWLRLVKKEQDNNVEHARRNAMKYPFNR